METCGPQEIVVSRPQLLLGFFTLNLNKDGSNGEFRNTDILHILYFCFLLVCVAQWEI